MGETSGFLERPDGAKLAWRAVAGAGPAVVWLGGFRSDMAGTKAQALADWAQARGRAYVRFDYFGHGESGGDFAHGTITRWRDDALAVLEALVEGPAVLVGSSMGGWISCLVAGTAPERVAAMVRKGSGVRVQGVPDLAKLRVGVNAGYAYGPLIDDLKGLNKVEAADPATLLRDLAEGRSDVALGNELTLNHVALQLKLLHRLENQRTLSSAPLFIGFAKAQGAQAQELADGFDRALKELNEEGIAGRIRAQY